MKFAIRLTLLAVFALAISVGLVSAQDEVSGTFVQAASTYTMTMTDDSLTLHLDGVASVTPLLLSNGAVGGYPTADFLADWIATEMPANALITFQLGNPLEADETGVYLRDFRVTATLTPVESEEGITYSVTIVEVASTDIFGDSPSEIEVVETDKAEDALVAYFNGEEVLEGENLTVLVVVNTEFVTALSVARVDRLNGARPSGVSGSCIPNVTC